MRFQANSSYRLHISYLAVSFGQPLESYKLMYDMIN